MNDDLELLRKRLKELYDKSDRGGYFTFTDFLGLAEQSVLADILPKLNRDGVTLYGGAEGAERVMARFGNVVHGYFIVHIVVNIHYRRGNKVVGCGNNRLGMFVDIS